VIVGESVEPHDLRARLPDAVLVPGLGLDTRAWTAVRACLDGSSRVVALPSLGRRATRGQDLHVEQQGRRLLASLPPDVDVILVGHSASCPVVVEAATRSPNVVGLVLVAPVTDPRARTWPRMLLRWAGTAVHERVWELPVLVPQYRSTGPDAMVRGMTRMRLYRTDVALASRPVPTIVIRGERDRIAPSQWCADVADVVGAELVTVPRAAHMLPLTHPHVVADSVERLRAR
jgi:pimeloyl-ACP methyl ester carboxylesterase